jgi:uncharacterized membrane protein HdeD (DUF308 family)
MKGREAVYDGFYKRLAIGILSLVLSVLIFAIPKDIAKFLMIMLGLVAVVLGITLVVNAFRLRKMQLPGPIEKIDTAGQ